MIINESNINESSLDDDLIELARKTIDPVISRLKPGLGLMNPKYEVTFLGEVIASCIATKLVTKDSLDIGDISDYIIKNTKSHEKYYLVMTNSTSQGAVIKMAPTSEKLPNLEIKCTYNKPSIVSFSIKRKNLG